MPDTGEPAHPDDHLDAGAPPQEENEENKAESQTDDGIYLDFLTLVNKFVAKARLHELWEQIKNGTVQPEWESDRQAFRNWLREHQSRVNSAAAYDAIINGRPLDSEMDDTGVALQFLVFMQSRQAVTLTNEKWRILWKRGAPIDPMPEKTITN